MRSLVVAALVASFLAAPCYRLSGTEPVPSLDDLLKEYRTLGLPLPPAEAKLVRYVSEGGGIVNRKIQPNIYSLAFQLRPQTKTQIVQLFKGTQQWESVWDANTLEVAPEPAAVKDLSLDADEALTLAIQCHSRGWDQLARHLLERHQSEAKSTPRKQLLRFAWKYWDEQLARREIDRAPIAKRLKGLMKEDRELDTPANRALLRSLDLALIPSKARPGSVEAMIDDLVDNPRGEHYARIARLGFEAVPALIEHLEDDRLTRGMMEQLNNFRSWHLRVRHKVSDLLQSIAGEEIGRNWLQRQQGYAVQKGEAKKWWQKAQKVGEEAYLLSRVLPEKTEPEGQRGIEYSQLRLIAQKYPRHLPSLYRTVVDKRPDLESSSLADAVLECKLSVKEKLELFLHGAAHKERRHSTPALLAIKELDEKRFNEVLLAALESFPKDVPEPYWKCQVSPLSRLAIESGDARLWDALEKAVRRSSLGLRMEMFQVISDAREKKRRPERLRLLASFLDDKTVRDLSSSKQFDGPCAGFHYDRIEVRDFVALELASLLEMKVEFKLERTPEEWTKLRNRVRVAMKREQEKRDGKQDER